MRHHAEPEEPFYIEIKFGQWFYWWLVTVTLVVAFGFYPKVLGGGGDFVVDF